MFDSSADTAFKFQASGKRRHQSPTSDEEESKAMRGPAAKRARVDEYALNSDAEALLLGQDKVMPKNNSI